MTTAEIYKRLEEVFKDVFDDDDIRISPDTTAADIDDWDSIEPVSYTHLTLPTT